jgi:hypothetical protein
MLNNIANMELLKRGDVISITAMKLRMGGIEEWEAIDDPKKFVWLLSHLSVSGMVVMKTAYNILTMSLPLPVSTEHDDNVKANYLMQAVYKYYTTKTYSMHRDDAKLGIAEQLNGIRKPCFDSNRINTFSAYYSFGMLCWSSAYFAEVVKHTVKANMYECRPCLLKHQANLNLCNNIREVLHYQDLFSSYWNDNRPL